MARSHSKKCRQRLLGVLITLLGMIHICTERAEAQDVSVHTNLLYWATATPNIGADFGLGRKVSLSATLGYNAFNFPNHTTPDGFDANPKLHHWLASGEVRYWLRHAFRGVYFGLHGLGGQYNAGGVRFPSFLKDTRYEGWGAGVGLGAGYHLPLGRHWGIEASVGAGLLHLHYTKYECGSCGRRLYTRSRNIFGLTKAAITVSYLFSTTPKREAPNAEEIIVEAVAESYPEIQMSDTAVIAEVITLPSLAAEDKPEAKADTAVFVIFFPVDRSEYLPDFADNRKEMSRLHACLDSIAASNGSVSLIRIRGYASPEYDAEHNLKLSEARARSAAGAMVAEGMASGGAMSVEGCGDDWDGLARSVPGVNTEHADKGWLNKHRNQLLEVYPPLRRAEIEIIYTIH